MRPESIALKGFTRFTAPIALDLTPLGPGLVALVGPTGGGKTSLMDALGGPVALWRRLSTRDGGLKEWCSGRDATIDLTFSYQGTRYRSLVQVDPEYSAGRGKEEAFLYRQDAAGAWETLTPGRVTDFDEMIEGTDGKPGLFPQQSLYMAAAFSAQDKGGNFFALEAPERKALFADLIGLEAYQIRADRAATARKILDAQMGDLDREVARVLESVAAYEAIARQIADAEIVIAPIAAAETDAEAALHAATDAGQRAIGLLQTLEAAQAAARKRMGELAQEEREANAAAATLRDRIQTLDLLVADADAIRADAAALVDASAALTNAATDYRAAEATTRTAQAARDAAVTARDRARADADRARATIAGADAARRDLSTVETRLAPLAALRVAYTQADAAVRAEEAALAPLRTNARNESQAADMRLRDARSGLETARAKAALLDGVPCKGGPVVINDGVLAGRAAQADCGTCRFLSDARTAAAKVDGLAADVERFKVEALAAADVARDVTERDALLAEHRAERDRIGRDRDALVPLEATASRLRAQVEGVGPAEAALADAVARQAVHEAEITAAGPALAAAEADEAAVMARGSVAKADKARLFGADVRLREVEAAAAQLPILRDNLTAADGRAFAAASARAEVVMPPDPVTQRAEAEAANTRTAVARTAHAAARQATQAARSRLDELRGGLRQLGDVHARRAAIEGQRQAVSAERAGYVLVEKAFGRDGGIQTLEMDAAGPEVSTLTNELLAACFGARFSIRMRTIQEAEGARKQKEVFDVEVFDAQRADHKPGPFKGLSGGEQALVGAAFRFGLAVFNARRRGAQFSSLFVDEMDQGLDPALIALYPSMLRRVQELGGFERVFYIAHPEAAWEQADHVIKVDGGAVWIER